MKKRSKNIALGCQGPAVIANFGDAIREAGDTIRT
jgi:hypothetical protein